MRACAISTRPYCGLFTVSDPAAAVVVPWLPLRPLALGAFTADAVLVTDADADALTVVADLAVVVGVVVVVVVCRRLENPAHAAVKWASAGPPVRAMLSPIAEAVSL